MIELEVILIIIHLRHMQPFRALVKSIPLTRHRGVEAVIRRDTFTQPSNSKMGMKSSELASCKGLFNEKGE